MRSTTHSIVAACFVFTCWAAVAQPVVPADLIQISAPDVDRAVVERTRTVLEGAITELKRALPPGDTPISIHICATLDDFKKLAGNYARSNASGIAIPARGIIVVKAPHLLHSPGGDYEGTLRHELIHVLLGRNVKEGNIPRWLDEGIAMHVSREYRWESLWQVGEMYFRNAIIPYSDLESVLEQPGTEMEFGNTYAQSLSMTRYLIERLGEEVFWDFVADMRAEHFSDVLHSRLAMRPLDFYDAWHDSLKSISWTVSIVSGVTLFQLAALLTIYVYWKKRRAGLVKMRQWAREDAVQDERAYPPSRYRDGAADDDDEIAYDSPIYDDGPLQPWEDDEDDEFKYDDDDDDEDDEGRQGRRAWWR